MKLIKLSALLISGYFTAACNPSTSDQGPYFLEIITDQAKQYQVFSANGGQLDSSNCQSLTAIGKYCYRYPLPDSQDEAIHFVSGASGDAVPVFDKAGIKFYSLLSLDTSELVVFGGSSFVVEAIFESTEDSSIYEIEKLDSQGNPLPDNAAQWACIHNKTTGLVWEHKTDDQNSIHYRGFQFQYFDGTHGEPSADQSCAGIHCDSQSLIAATRAKQLCGRTNWRLPSNNELYTNVGIGQANKDKIDGLFEIPALFLDDTAADIANSTIYFSNELYDGDFEPLTGHGLGLNADDKVNLGWYIGAGIFNRMTDLSGSNAAAIGRQTSVVLVSE